MCGDDELWARAFQVIRKTRHSTHLCSHELVTWLLSFFWEESGYVNFGFMKVKLIYMNCSLHTPTLVGHDMTFICMLALSRCHWGIPYGGEIGLQHTHECLDVLEFSGLREQLIST